MATVFRFIHSIDSFQVSKMLVQWPKIQLSLDISFCFCFPFCLSAKKTAPLCRRWPFCGSRWRCWAVTSHPLPSAACLLPLPLCLTLPVFCIASSTLHVSCQLCFALVSLLGSPKHTSSNELSVCSPSVSCHSPLLSCSLYFHPPASELPMAVVRHLYTQDTLSLTDVTDNTLHG